MFAKVSKSVDSCQEGGFTISILPCCDFGTTCESLHSTLKCSSGIPTHFVECIRASMGKFQMVYVCAFPNLIGEVCESSTGLFCELYYYSASRKPGMVGEDTATVLS